MVSGRRVVVLSVVTALVSLLSVSPVSAGKSKVTRWVDDDGKAGPTSCSGKKTAKKKIQSAVNASDTNDVIIVCPGTYTGTVKITGARRGLTIRGYSKFTAHVKAPRSIDGPLVWVQSVKDVTIKWLDLRFPTSSCGSRDDDVNGIHASLASGIHINTNQIRPQGSKTLGSCGYVDGILINRSKDARVIGNVIKDFKSDGIWFMNGSTGRIERNRISYYHTTAGTTAAGGQGITVDSSSALVQDNTVRSSSSITVSHLREGIVAQRSSGTVKVYDNKVWYVRTGIGSDDSTATIQDNSLRGVGDPVSGEQRGIHIFVKSGNKVRRNTVFGFEYGIKVESTGNTLENNEVSKSDETDCVDTTTGSGTAGTGNTWTGNTGATTGKVADPEGICTPSVP